MRLRELDARRLGDAAVAGFSVGGLGAYVLLAQESGLHVLETPDEAQPGTVRVRARVRVAPQPDGLGEGEAAEAVGAGSEAISRLGPSV